MRKSHTLHEMHLRRLSDRVGHTAPRKTLRGNTRSDDKETSLRVLLEVRQGFLDVLLGPHDLGCPAAVPFVVFHRAQVGKVGEASPACIGDYAINAAERIYGVLNTLLAVIH